MAAGNAVTLPANGFAPVLRAPKGVGAPPPPNPVNGRDPGLGREPQGCRVTGGGGGRTKVGAGKEGITKCCGCAGVQKQHTWGAGTQHTHGETLQQYSMMRLGTPCVPVKINGARN